MQKLLICTYVMFGIKLSLKNSVSRFRKNGQVAEFFRQVWKKPDQDFKFEKSWCEKPGLKNSVSIKIKQLITPHIPNFQKYLFSFHFFQ